MIDLTNPSWELKLNKIRHKKENYEMDIFDIDFLFELIEELKDKIEEILKEHGDKF